MQKNSRYHQTNLQLINENEIVEQAKKDPRKFEVLYNKYFEQIFRYVYQRMDDIDTANDVTSQVFYKAITKLHKYEFRGVPFSSWLYRIAMSEVYQWFKDNKASRTVNMDSQGIFNLIKDDEQSPDNFEDEDNSKLKQLLIKAIAELPEKDLQIIEMRYFEKRSYREIGEILDITENNAKVKAYRIVGKLRGKLPSAR